MAPTIIQTKNLRVMVYLHDHFPPHVHVIGPNQEAKFLIETLECTYSRGFSEKALGQIKDFLEDKKKILMEAWDEFQK